MEKDYKNLVGKNLVGKNLNIKNYVNYSLLRRIP